MKSAVGERGLKNARGFVTTSALLEKKDGKGDNREPVREEDKDLALCVAWELPWCETVGNLAP